MVTFPIKILMSRDNDPPLFYCEGHCLSTDEKPTAGIYNGSHLTEMDSSKLFHFDAENIQWLEWGAST